jgi:integrase
LAFFGGKTLAQVNGDVCRRYAAQRSTDAAARRELEDLRAAINHHRREGLCSQIVEVVLPREQPARDRWLTRSEAARLILAAWRYREVQKGKATDRRSRQHIAKFILVALYTGTRASAVCGAALGAMTGRGWIDLDRGVFYRRPAGRLETKKRTPPVPLPAFNQGKASISICFSRPTPSVFISISVEGPVLPGQSIGQLGGSIEALHLVFFPMSGR